MLKDSNKHLTEILEAIQILWPYLLGMITATATVLYFIYQRLVDNKNSTIELKDTIIENLREDIRRHKDRISELEATSPDVLVSTMKSRMKCLEDEITALNMLTGRNDEIVSEKEAQLESMSTLIQEYEREKIKITEILQKYDLVCPTCGAPMTFSEPHFYQEGPHEWDAMYYEYECGYAHEDGKEVSECEKEIN